MQIISQTVTALHPPVNKVNTLSISTGTGCTLVDVDLAVGSSEAGRTFASVSGDGIAAHASVLADSAQAVVDVDVTLLSSEARRTDALVGVDQIGADASVDARAGSAFVNVHFAVNTRVT